MTRSLLWLIARRELALSLRSRAVQMFALLFGVFILYGVGFAGPMVLHNAAHDVRHAFAFPCH